MSSVRYKPISIDEVMSKPRSDVDLYLRLGEAKFIVIAKAGMTTPAEHLAKYKSKNVQYLWVKEDDFHTLVRQTISVAGMVVNQKKVADLSKLSVVEQATSAVFREVEAMGFNDIVFSHSKMVTEATMVLIQSNPQIADILARYSDLKGNAAHHGMLVSLFSGMLGVQHGWTKPLTLEKLALGGLLHDIGKIKLPKEIADKPVWMLSKDEILIYKSHVELGRQMLSEIKGMPEDVASIAYEHHERSDGSGFPRGVKDFAISPLARVVALANEFVEILGRATNGLNDRSVVRALEEIEINKTGQFNRDAVKALKKMVNREETKAVG